MEGLLPKVEWLEQDQTAGFSENQSDGGVKSEGGDLMGSHLVKWLQTRSPAAALVGGKRFPTVHVRRKRE